jgi:twitching motility protein PilJ
MVKFGFQEWFQDLKTQSKLMVGFGIVSVIILTMTVIGIVTLRQLSSQSQTVYLDYTIPLSDFSSMGTSLTQHHELLLDIAKTNRKDDFQKEVARLAPLKQSIMKNVSDYEVTAVRVSRSGRDETKDLGLLKPALAAYFQESEAALSAFIDSFDSSQMTAEQGKEMRGLGVLALTTNLTPTFEKLIGRHGEQVATMRDVAKDLNDDSQGLARNGTLLLLLGGAVAVALGLGIGFIMARYFSHGVTHIARRHPDICRHAPN